MRAILLTAALFAWIAPAYADCQRSPFSGMVICSPETVPSFANEEVPAYSPPPRSRQTVCDTERTPWGYTTTCRGE